MKPRTYAEAIEGIACAIEDDELSRIYDIWLTVDQWILDTPQKLALQRLCNALCRLDGELIVERGGM